MIKNISHFNRCGSIVRGVIKREQPLRTICNPDHAQRCIIYFDPAINTVRHAQNVCCHYPHHDIVGHYHSRLPLAGSYHSLKGPDSPLRHLSKTLTVRHSKTQWVNLRLPLQLRPSSGDFALMQPLPVPQLDLYQVIEGLHLKAVRLSNNGCSGVSPESHSHGI